MTTATAERKKGRSKQEPPTAPTPVVGTLTGVGARRLKAGLRGYAAKLEKLAEAAENVGQRSIGATARREKRWVEDELTEQLEPGIDFEAFAVGPKVRNALREACKAECRRLRAARPHLFGAGEEDLANQVEEIAVEMEQVYGAALAAGADPGVEQTALEVEK